jgi:hypothetical protein
VFSCNAGFRIGVLRSFQTANALFSVLAPLIPSISSIQHRVCQKTSDPEDSLQLIENIFFIDAPRRRFMIWNGFDATPAAATVATTP